MPSDHKTFCGDHTIIAIETRLPGSVSLQGCTGDQLHSEDSILAEAKKTSQHHPVRLTLENHREVKGNTLTVTAINRQDLPIQDTPKPQPPSPTPNKKHNTTATKPFCTGALNLLVKANHQWRAPKGEAVSRICQKKLRRKKN